MQNIKNNIAVSLIVAVFLLALTEITPHDTLPQSNAEVNPKSESVYVLKEYNGIIGLFEHGKNSPCEVYDVAVKHLPESDIAALSAGIDIYSSEQLRQLIEDYSG